jgi:hypothetical protein
MIMKFKDLKKINVVFYELNAYDFLLFFLLI